MALPDTFKVQSGTAKVFAASGGDAAITLASLADSAARQSAKIDLGSVRARRYRVSARFEFAATPTAGNYVHLYWAPSESATAGTDNPGGVGGTDAAYSGYSSNLDASLPQLVYIGSFRTTAQATATVQAGEVGIFEPPSRYGTLVVKNAAGAAMHSSGTNMSVTFTPIEQIVQE